MAFVAMNEAQFLRSLNSEYGQNVEAHTGLSAPPYIPGPNHIPGSAYEETVGQVMARIEHNHGVAGRACPRRRPGSVML